MRLSRNVYLIASGSLGCGLSNERDCNAYAVQCGNEFLLVDAGVGVETGRIRAALQADGIAPGRISGLLLTHGHLDHSGGVCELTNEGGIAVYASSEAARALATADEEAISLAAAKQAGVYPASFRFQACPVAHALDGGETWPIGDARIHALRTPGHSDDMLSFLIETSDGVLCFPGDTVFHGGRVLLADAWDCRPYALARSLQLLASRRIDALFPGHGLWSLTQGGAVVEQTLPFLERGLLPPNLLT